MMRYLLCIFLAFFVLQAALAMPAMAAGPNNCANPQLPKPPKNNSKFEIGMCAQQHTGNMYQPWEFTTKLVDCIEYTIRSATMNMLTIIANEFGWLTTILGTLVIMFYGVRVATGERELLKQTGIIVLKVACVIGAMTMMPDIVDAVFNALDWLMQLVTGGMSPWSQIDTFLGHLVGFGPSIVLLNGLLGLVGAATFSSNVGVAMFFFGILAILNLLTFILAMIYTYCLAFMTIGFLLVFMPVLIPLALFHYTENYFKKAIDIIITAILVPVLLFAFVWMFIGIFDILIQNIFAILGGRDFKAYWRMNTSLFSWLMPSDPNTNAMLQNISTSQDLPCVERGVKPPVQTNINPLAKEAFDVGLGRTATLNFGQNEVGIVQHLSFAFLQLWIFSSLMKSMVNLIPSVAASISGAGNYFVFGAGSNIVQKIQGNLNKAQSKLQQGATEDLKKGLSNFTKQMQNFIGKRDR